jgi:hypothetical protein
LTGVAQTGRRTSDQHLLRETRMKPFSEFIRTDEGRRAGDPALLDRIAASGDSITSLNNLVKFARERFPDHYSDDPRKSLDRPCGANAMRTLWAAYLTWAEMAPATAAADKATKSPLPK